MKNLFDSFLSFHMTQHELFLLTDVLLILVLLITLIAVRKWSKKKLPPKTGKPLFVPRQNFAHAIKYALLKSSRDIQNTVPEIEEILLTADVGIAATERLIKKILADGAAHSHEAATNLLKHEIQTLLTPKDSFAINTAQKPYVIYLTGVNGSGKTTTIGKLACQFATQGHKVLLVAADTFRAAAVEQLRLWAERNSVDFVGGAANADPASVIVDGLRAARSRGIDVVLVDTAGRLQTKTNLMNELGKMVRMTEKELGRNPDQIFLVVDAITGQNGFSQARIFCQAVPITGVILTKYDATAKGGIIISIVQETGLPIRYVGLGEGINDLREFDANEFVENLFL